MKKDSETIAVIVVDDHTIVRHGLCQSLSKQPIITVVAEAENGRQAIDLASKFCPDVILMDINMPDLNGMDATKQILKTNSEIKIIALSTHSNHMYVMGMLNAGASGFILKSCSFAELVEAITNVSAGKRYLCPDVTGMVMDSALNPDKKLKKAVSIKLTTRDREVLQLVAEGKKSSEIGEMLNISKRTVDLHRRNLMDKLNIRSIAELTKYAIREGITTL